MLDSIKTEVDNIVKTINATINTDKIFLFGSYAYGKPTENSDIDLCVITNETESRIIDLMKKIRKAIIHSTTKSVDLLVYYPDVFQQRASLNCTLEHKISSEGINIYEK